jgi:hypothetical protein
MRAFAEGLYRRVHGTGPARNEGSFKKGVDTEYEAVRQKDMERAYQMNISAKSEVKYVVEDRFRVYSGLYDNPLVQALMNRVGQSVVPGEVSQLYTFKLIADPVPWAEALSTGTVWVSTGLVSLMTSKAQLAYVLSHEAAHVYLNHHRQRIMLEHAEQEYNRQMQENLIAEQPKPQQQGNQVTEMLTNMALRRLPLMGVGGGIGGRLASIDPSLLSLVNGTVTNSGMLGNSPLGGTLAGSLLRGGSLLTPSLLTQSMATLGLSGTGSNPQPSPRFIQHTEWNRFEEDAADRMAFDWLMAENMDIEQIPSVYMVLKDAGDKDPRIQLGFLGKTDRIRQRLEIVRARIDAEKKKPGWVSTNRVVTDQEFSTLLAEIKRDNGVFAFHHDMLESARDNLYAAVQEKKSDPTALYFYAKVLAQTARTDNEREQADEYFLKASLADQRNQNYGAHLHRALILLTKKNVSRGDKEDALKFLKLYLLGYHFANADGQLTGANYPPHLEAIYDYMARAGITNGS